MKTTLIEKEARDQLIADRHGQLSLGKPHLDIHFPSLPTAVKTLHYIPAIHCVIHGLWTLLHGVSSLAHRRGPSMMSMIPL